MKRMLQTIAVALFATIFAGNRSEAGLQTITGSEWHLWSEDRYSVIVARVAAIGELKPGEGNGTHSALFEPLGVLAGSLDPSEHPTLSVTFHFSNGMTSSIIAPPAKGSIVLAVMQGDRFVVSDICTFMPNRSSLVEIKGLDDPRIIETLKKLQDARAHAEPDPHIYSPATTKKSTATRPK